MRDPGGNNFIKMDTASALKQYPKLLERTSAKGERVLEGELDIKGPSGVVVESYTVKILYTNRFPYAYPKVLETGGKFSRTHTGLHINGDGTLCLNAEPLEAIDTYRGLGTCEFIERVLLPNLAWRTCKLEEIDDELEDFSHNIKGILEAYMSIFAIDDPKLTLSIIETYAAGSLPSRNDLCVCGSGKKFKHCHEDSTNKLAKIPRDMVSTHIQKLKEYLN